MADLAVDVLGNGGRLYQLVPAARDDKAAEVTYFMIAASQKLNKSAGQLSESNPERATLPPFITLGAISLAANMPAVGLYLFGNKLGIALSILAGYLIGMVVYGFLYAFVTKGLDLFIKGMRGSASPDIRGPIGSFVVLLVVKFIALGALVFGIVRFGHVNILALAFGAVVTQIAMTCSVVVHMERNKLIRSKN